jgi:hypothetical protein
VQLLAALREKVQVNEYLAKLDKDMTRGPHEPPET